MTLGNTTVRQLYQGDGSTTTFLIPFAYFQQSEIQVYVRTESVTPATEVLQTVGVNYSLSPSTYPSTSVVFSVAPTSNQKVLIIRALPLTQTVDYSSSGSFPADTHENALDRLTAQVQQMSETLDRCLKVRKTTTVTSTELPDPSQSNLLGWNTSGTGLANYSASALGSVTVSVGGAANGTGGGTWYDGNANAPEAVSENGEKVFLFSAGESQKLTWFVKVPQAYVAGQPIKMYINGYSPSSSNTFLLQTTSYLIRKNTDAIDSVTNSRVSTNSAVTNTVANQSREIIMDLSSSIGAINSVAISPGDLIRVDLTRGSDSDTAAIRFVPSSTEVTFQ